MTYVMCSWCTLDESVVYCYRFQQLLKLHIIFRSHCVELHCGKFAAGAQRSI